MNMKGLTLGKALKTRATLAGKIAQSCIRAEQNAVRVADDPTVVDFNTNDQLDLYCKGQHDLRTVKFESAKLSINTKVLIPKGLSVEEAGTEVSVYSAVLIRDDLKGRKQLVERLIGLPMNPTIDYNVNPPALRPKKRNFDFDKMLAYSEQLQEAIDVIDGIIQGTDAVTRFE